MLNNGRGLSDTYDAVDALSSAASKWAGGIGGGNYTVGVANENTMLRDAKEFAVRDLG